MLTEVECQLPGTSHYHYYCADIHSTFIPLGYVPQILSWHQRSYRINDPGTLSTHLRTAKLTTGKRLTVAKRRVPIGPGAAGGR